MARGHATAFQEFMGSSCFSDLWRFLPTGHHWHTETYACSQAVVITEGSLIKMLVLTIELKVCSFCQFSSKEAQWIFSFVALAVSDLVSQEVQIYPSCLHRIMIYKRNSLFKRCCVTADILPQEPNEYVQTELPAWIWRVSSCSLSAVWLGHPTFPSDCITDLTQMLTAPLDVRAHTSSGSSNQSLKFGCVVTENFIILFSFILIQKSQ